MWCVINHCANTDTKHHEAPSFDIIRIGLRGVLSTDITCVVDKTSTGGHNIIPSRGA